jgi:hypothetical protein
MFPPLSSNQADETPMGGYVEDRGIVRVDGKAVNVVELIERSKARGSRKDHGP